MDIIKGLGNANKIMNRLLFDGFTNYGLRISLLDSAYSEFKRIESKSVENSFYFKIEQAGNYFLLAELIVNGEVLTSDSSKVSILPNNLENTRRGLNEKELRKLSENNNGVYIHYDALDTLNYEMNFAKKYSIMSREFAARRSYLLYFLMFLALLGDWILRKVNGGI